MLKPKFKKFNVTCPHDCPDTCSLEVTVDTEANKAVKLLGSKSHPITKGFLCNKVNHYLDLVYNKNRRVLFSKLIYNQTFLIMLSIIIAVSIYTLKIIKGDDKKTKRIKNATRQGIIAFIIALASYLDLKAAPFFIIWATSYYLHFTSHN